MRLIDADKIRILTDLEDENGDAVVTLADVRKAIMLTPTEDAVKVVRCKDCERYISSVLEEPATTIVRMDTK